MELGHILFLVSQVVFLPTFILTTKKLFDKDMGLSGYVKYALMSPFFIYIYSLVIFGIMTLIMPSAIVYELAAYADIFALCISFAISLLYAYATHAENKSVAVFIYNTFYMIGMVFNLVYDEVIPSIIFSVIIPTAVSILFYRNITATLVRIEASLTRFQPGMMMLPVASEMLLVLRFLIIIISNLDSSLAVYDHFLTIYSTAFGYIILIFVFVATYMISLDLKQIDIIRGQKESLILENKRNEKLSLDMLMALVGTIEAKDEYTTGHSMRVADYSKMIAESLGMDEKEIDKVYKIALLHDIGKIGIPDEIIMKPGKLTKEEYEIIKQHPVTGSEILSRIEEMPELHIGAKFHHERWDGKGYPSGLKGEEIPLEARIISVADAYDAMTSKRSYRDALSDDAVIDELTKGIGTQFYPDAAVEMLRIITEENDCTTD